MSPDEHDPPGDEFPDEEATRPGGGIDEFPDEEATQTSVSLPDEEAPAHQGEATPAEDGEATPAGGTTAPADASAPAGETPEDRASHLRSIVESLLFAADRPLSLQQLGQLLGEHDLGPIRQSVAELEADFAARGIQLHGVAGGYQFRTNPQNAVWVQKLLAQKPVRLTRAQLETLAICAYRQPITRPEIDDIRGVDSGGTLKTLMDRSLVRILGKKEEPGRPMLYGTTREFLEFFNLRDLKDLPTLREFHELSEEHQAQVAALESVAPEGSIDGGGEPAPQAGRAAPLERVELAPVVDDSEELEEIDRLIRTAGDVPMTDGDPVAPTKPEPEA